MNKLYYLGPPGDGFGWGVANTNLIAALEEFCEVILDTSARDTFDAPVFVPVMDQSLRPLRRIKAPRILGYCFTEWPIPEGAYRQARQYDVLFAGSTWNAQRLEEAGCRNVQVLLQGIDHLRFGPQPPSDRKGFVVFSGGKFEFRKGQDYVIAAMRVFMRERKDVVLIASWHNPWPQSMASMINSWLIDPANPYDGLPEDRVILAPPIPNKKNPQLYSQAHIGLFPNRCEAGTNLVMCEFMACQRPIIATFATGHQDIFPPPPGIRSICHLPSAICYPDGPYLLTTGTNDPAGWFNCEVSDIITALEHAYNHRDQLADRARHCHDLVQRLSWSDCARKICAAAFSSGSDSEPGSSAAFSSRPHQAESLPALDHDSRQSAP